MQMTRDRRVLTSVRPQKTDAERIAELEALVHKLSAAKPKPTPSLKVSAKGAVSLYGLGRWPVTLYAAQWETVLDMAEDIREFIADNEAKLSRKE